MLCNLLRISLLKTEFKAVTEATFLNRGQSANYHISVSVDEIFMKIGLRVEVGQRLKGNSPI